MLKRVVALLLILISISLLSSFILSLNFSKTGFEGFIGEGFKGGEDQGPVNPPLQSYQTAGYDQTTVFGGGGGGEGGSGNHGGMSSFSNLNSPFNPPNVPLFFVEGLDNTTNYLRLYTSATYENGVWKADELQCSSPSVPLNPKRFKVTPIVNLTDYLPVAKDTRAVVPLKQDEIFDCYDPDRGVFSTTSVSTPYYGYSTAAKITPTSFDGTASYNDWEIRALAEEITKNASSDYEKVQAIAGYLMKNYINMPEKYSGDPIRDFLFVKKAGTCREFASAFVLLSQSLGIPSRVVFGYLAEPKPENQTIFASDAYVWAEVKFREGWVEFDACPRGTAIETETEIEYVDAKIVAGENFSVRGSVRDINGNPVDGFVEVYFKQDKNASEGILVGVAPVNGEFNITLKAPDVTGRYNVVAHYTGSRYYAESWSDPEVEVYYRPAFNVTLPDRVAQNFLLSGTLETWTPYTGVVKLCIDRMCEDLLVKNGSFEKPLSLSTGNHSIALLFGGSGYLLPVEYTKTVEAGVVEVVINSTVREGENLTGRVLFNGETVNATLLIDGVRVQAINGNFSVHVPLKLGRNELNVTVADFLYTKKMTVFLKREVEIDTRTHDDLLQVVVRDAEGNPADGFVEYGGVRKQLVNGVAEFRLLEDDRIVIYSGSEKYLPAIKELGGFSPILFLPLIAALAGFLGYILWRRMRRVEDLLITVEKEHPALPNVWDVGEKIKVRLSEPALVKVDGISEFTDTLELSFDSYGLRKITAEKEEGKIRKRGELEIRIMPYLEGIAEIAKKLEKNVERAESKTIREVLKERGVEMPVLLRYFEEGRYGGREYTRREFVEAFREYLRVMGDGEVAENN